MTWHAAQTLLPTYLQGNSLVDLLCRNEGFRSKKSKCSTDFNLRCAFHQAKQKPRRDRMNKAKPYILIQQRLKTPI